MLAEESANPPMTPSRVANYPTDLRVDFVRAAAPL